MSSDEFSFPPPQSLHLDFQNQQVLNKSRAEGQEDRERVSAVHGRLHQELLGLERERVPAPAAQGLLVQRRRERSHPRAHREVGASQGFRGNFHRPGAVFSHWEVSDSDSAHLH